MLTGCRVPPQMPRGSTTADMHPLDALLGPARRVGQQRRDRVMGVGVDHRFPEALADDLAEAPRILVGHQRGIPRVADHGGSRSHSTSHRAGYGCLVGPFPRQRAQRAPQASTSAAALRISARSCSTTYPGVVAEYRGTAVLSHCTRLASLRVERCRSPCARTPDGSRCPECAIIQPVEVDRSKSPPYRRLTIRM